MNTELKSESRVESYNRYAIIGEYADGTYQLSMGIKGGDVFKTQPYIRLCSVLSEMNEFFNEQN